MYQIKQRGKYITNFYQKKMFPWKHLDIILVFFNVTIPLIFILAPTGHYTSELRQLGVLISQY